MSKDNGFQKEAIRFYPDGTSEVIGQPKELADLVRDPQKSKPKNRHGFELWGDLSVRKTSDKPPCYEDEDEGLAD